MDERILRRIDRAAGVDDLAGALERLAPTDPQTLLLEVAARRARRLAPKDVLDRYARNRFGYYASLCFKVYVGDLEVADGGFTTWTQALLGDRAERLLISGMGTERVAGRPA